MSRGVDNDSQKVALLLHTGGMELQELFYQLIPEDASDVCSNYPHIGWTFSATG